MKIRDDIYTRTAPPPEISMAKLRVKVFVKCILREIYLWLHKPGSYGMCIAIVVYFISYI